MDVARTHMSRTCFSYLRVVSQVGLFAQISLGTTVVTAAGPPPSHGPFRSVTRRQRPLKACAQTPLSQARVGKESRSATKDQPTQADPSVCLPGFCGQGVAISNIIRPSWRITNDEDLGSLLGYSSSAFSNCWFPSTWTFKIFRLFKH